MTRGRKPKPTHLKLVQGNRGKRALNNHEPQPTKVIGEPPAELCPDAKLEWSRVADEMRNLGLLTSLDRAVFSAYCQSYGIWAAAHRALREASVLDPAAALTSRTGNGNIIVTPLLGIANKAARDMQRFATELGMTPSARSRVTVTPPKDEDPTAKYFD